MVILDRTAFYPTSGGQAHDIGTIGEGGQYRVINVEKCGAVVLHFLDRPMAEKLGLVACQVDRSQRNQLKNHHTATHLVFAMCRRLLGPHIWQQGAKKTMECAHLDISHYESLTQEQEEEVESLCNRSIMRGIPVIKKLVDKQEAEKEHGFQLYQGGVVPGRQLRLVEIVGVDIEACCGTHADNLSEIGWVKILSSRRIADGVLRLYFVAGERTIEEQSQ